MLPPCRRLAAAVIVAVTTACGTASPDASSADVARVTPAGSASGSEPATLPTSASPARGSREDSQSSPASVQVRACWHSSGRYRVVLPDGWWTNPRFEDEQLGTVAACRFFAPNAFDVTTASRETPVPTGTAIWIDFLDEGCVGYINPMLSSRETTVAGYPAFVTELADGTETTDPPGTYQYVVAVRADIGCETGGRYVHAFTRREFAGGYEANKAALDQMMETIEVRAP
jgi:hypothetical protein